MKDLWGILFLCLFVGIIIGIIKFAKAYTVLFLILLAIIITIISILIILKKRKEKKIRNLYIMFDEEKEILYKENRKSDRLNAIQTIKKIYNELINLVESEIIDSKINKIHQEFLFEIIKDCKITEEEKEILKSFETTFYLSSETIRKNRREAYITAYSCFIKDRILTKDEENILQHIFLQLEINPKDIIDEQNFLADLSLARELAGKELNPIATPFDLKSNEQCFFSSNDASIHKTKQQNYYILPSEKMEVFGKLYITNQRIIISSSENISFVRNLSAIDTITNWNDFYIKISFLGKEKALFLKCAKPYLTRVMISKYLDKLRTK